MPARNWLADSSVIDINPDEESEDEENAPEERVTAFDVLNVIRKYSNQASRREATTCSASSKSTSRSDATACAGSPAQASNAPEDEYDELEDDDSDADEEPEDDAEEHRKPAPRARNLSLDILKIDAAHQRYRLRLFQIDVAKRYYRLRSPTRANCFSSGKRAGRMPALQGKRQRPGDLGAGCSGPRRVQNSYHAPSLATSVARDRRPSLRRVNLPFRD